MEASKRKVRQIKPEEVNKHLEMLNLAFAPWGNKKEWENKYNQPDFETTQNIIVVEEDGNWAGGGTAWFRDGLIGEKKVKIYMPGDLHTHPDFTGKGVYSTAMQALNRLGWERNAVLGITFPSPLGFTFQILPKYGFYDVFRPRTKIKLLKPESLFPLLEGEKISLLRKLEGKRIAVTTPGENILFEVRDSSLMRAAEARKPDITIKSDLQTLFNIFASYRRGKGKLILSAVGAVLSRRLSMRTSLKNLVTMVVS